MVSPTRSASDRCRVPMKKTSPIISIPPSSSVAQSTLDAGTYSTSSRQVVNSDTVWIDYDGSTVKEHKLSLQISLLKTSIRSVPPFSSVAESTLDTGTIPTNHYCRLLIDNNMPQWFTIKSSWQSRLSCIHLYTQSLREPPRAIGSGTSCQRQIFGYKGLPPR